MERKQPLIDFFSDTDIKNLPSYMSCQQQDYISSNQDNLIDAIQPCIFNDMFYNVVVHINDQKNNKQTLKDYKVQVDLSLPFSWLRSDDCKQQPDPCVNKTKKSFFKNCDKSCTFMKQYSNTHSCKQDSCTRTTNSASIAFPNQTLLSGNFVIDKMIINPLEEEQFQISLSKYKFLSVDSIYNLPNFATDGALGLGYEGASLLGQSRKAVRKSEKHKTNLLTEFLNEIDIETDHQFTIYIKELENAALFIGRDIEQYHQDKQPYKFVSVSLDENFLGKKFGWNIPIQEMIIGENFSDTDPTRIFLNKKVQTAQLTLSTSFLLFPKRIINQIVKTLNLLDADCYVNDNAFGIVYCNRLKILDHMLTDDVYIKIEPELLVKKCLVLNKKQKYYKCIMNIQQSGGEHIVFGEPFFKYQLLSFLPKEGKIGFVPAATTDQAEKYYIEGVDQPDLSLLLYISLFSVFAIISIFICKKCIRHEKLIYTYERICLIFSKQVDFKYRDSRNLQQNGIDDDRAIEFQEDFAKGLDNIMMNKQQI